MSRRDLRAEARWLERAELVGGRSGFAEHVTARLGAGAVAYGDRWAELGLDHLLIELGEEAADLGGWGVLALQALDQDHALCDESRAQLAAGLERAIAFGARAHRQLVSTRLELKRPADSARARAYMLDVGGRCSTGVDEFAAPEAR